MYELASADSICPVNITRNVGSFLASFSVARVCKPTPRDVLVAGGG